MHEITNFMWPWQHLFLPSAQFKLERLIRMLDTRPQPDFLEPEELIPRIFLLGFLLTNRSDRHSVCVYPDDCEHKATLFTGLIGQVSALSNTVTFGRHYAQNELRRTICQIVERTTRHPVTLCSEPSIVEDYLVFIVIEMNRAAYELVPRVDKSEVDSVKVFPSLVDAAVDEYLDVIGQQLSIRNAGEDLLFKVNLDAIRRTAGENLIRVAATRSVETMELQNFFQRCNTIASLKYEGEEGSGQLVIAPPTHPNLKLEIGFSTPLSLSEHRGVRKIIQTCSQYLHVLFHDGHIYGLGGIRGNYDPKRKDLFAIQFVKHNCWRFLHGRQPLMFVNNGTPSLPQDEFDAETVKSQLAEVFENIGPEAIDYLASLAERAATQKHGTMLVISEQAVREAGRLGGQCIRINPLKLSVDIVGLVTAIDGAVLLDADGNCHAIGVILDGHASEKGLSSRGARYNSAIRYVDSAECACLAVVISEDGMIDILASDK